MGNSKQMSLKSRVWKLARVLSVMTFLPVMQEMQQLCQSIK